MLKILILLFLLSSLFLTTPCNVPCKGEAVCVQSCKAMYRLVPDFLEEGLCPNLVECNVFATKLCIDSCGWFKLGVGCEKGCKLYKIKKNGKIQKI